MSSSLTHVSVPLVGRESELDELETCLQQVLERREPQSVTLVGPPGIGKTRLLVEFLDRVARLRSLAIEGHKTRIYRGWARDKGPTLAAIQEILRSRFRIPYDADPHAMREMFRQEVTTALGDRRVTEFLHFLGRYLDLRFPDSPFIRAVEDEPRHFGPISRAVLRRFFETDATQSPLILTFEEMHWAHDDSLDLTKYLIETLSGAPVLVITVARPELMNRRPQWSRLQGRHRVIELPPLPRAQSQELMERLLLPAVHVPQELIDTAVEVSGGNPYLLEQTIHTFFDNGTLRMRDDGRWHVDVERLGEAQLPLSVDDAISARLAALTPTERELLEMASVMGSSFWRGALVTLSRIDRPPPELWGGTESVAAHIADTLLGLVERDLIAELPYSSIAGDSEYVFRHHLERETLLRLANPERVQRYHRALGEWLEFRLAERAEEQCEQLAGHFAAGRLSEKAAGYYLLAGQRAQSRYANQKAAEYYGRGLRLLGDTDAVRRLEALHQYGSVLHLGGRNQEAQAAFYEMLELAYRLDLKAKGGAAHNRLGRLYRARGELDEAMRHLGAGCVLFRAARDTSGVAASYDDVGKVHWIRGDYEAAERFMTQSLELRHNLGDPRSLALSYHNLGVVYHDSGRFGKAQSMLRESLSIRQSIMDRHGIAETLNSMGATAQDSGDYVQAVRLHQEALELAQAVGDRMLQAVVLTNLGHATYRLNQPSEAIEVLKHAEGVASTLGDRILQGEVLRGLAKAHLLVDDISSAHGYVDRSVELFQEARGKPLLGLALRTQAEIYAAAGGGGPEAKQAKDSFERALALFEDVGNDMELANTCDAFAAFLESGAKHGIDPVITREARAMRTRAQDIRQRIRGPEGFEFVANQKEESPP